MSPISYSRSGGGTPLFDELLEIADDGSFTMKRTIAMDRAGTFAGTVPAASLNQLRDALAEVGDPVVIDPTMPKATIERIGYSGGTSRFPMTADLSDEWTEVQSLFWDLIEELKAYPKSVLELSADPSAKVATLRVIGEQSFAVDLSSSRLVLDLFDSERASVGHAKVALPSALANESTLAAGSSSDIPLDHDLPFDPSGTLRIMLDFELEGDDAQLFTLVGKPWW